MVEKGYITVEDLDTPSPGFIANTAVDRHHFPCGYPGLTYRNLLRDPDPIEAVEVSDPRDFTPATSTAGTPADSVPGLSAQICLEAHRPTDGLLDHFSGQHQDPCADGADQQDQGRSNGLGLHGDDAPQLCGDLPDDW
jgi:hypothetical protein